MKKLLSIVLSLCMLASLCLLTSCGKQDDPTVSTEETTVQEAPIDEIRVLTLMGPTGMGMAKLIDDDNNQKAAYNYTFTVASAPDQISAEVIKGNFEIAAVPVNLASVLYNKTGGAVQVAGVNTLGVLYILENGNTIGSVADLKGKTIYATGQGANPEYTLRYILSKNNIDPDKDVTIEFLAEHAELASKMAAGEVAVGMLPEPNVTSAMVQNADLRIALDLTEEWGKVADAELVQGCIIVNKTFAEEHPAAVKTFLEEYGASVKFVNENIDEASALIEAAGIVPKAAIAKRAIPNCNIVLVTGDEMKPMVSGMLKVLFEAAPASVGGQLPDDGLYYTVK